MNATEHAIAIINFSQSLLLNRLRKAPPGGRLAAAPHDINYNLHGSILPANPFFKNPAQLRSTSEDLVHESIAILLRR